MRDRFADLCATIGQAVPFSGLRINPPLGIEESKYFLLGLEDGLFLPDEEGYVQSELLPPLSQGNTKQKMCQIFWHNPPPPRLFREGVCQLSPASSLILKRGWLQQQILRNQVSGAPLLGVWSRYFDQVDRSEFGLR